MMIVLILLFLTLPSYSQDLFKERIRKLSNNKISIYVEKGIFHNGGAKTQSTLKSLRQSFNSKQGFERIVMDFTTNNVPRVYGHINSEEKQLYLDIFETSLVRDFTSPDKTRYIEKINFFPIESNHLSLDIKLKNKVIADIFTLDNPGRLVIDLKN